jgi:hypothetical protein
MDADSTSEVEQQAIEALKHLSSQEKEQVARYLASILNTEDTEND